MGSSSWSRLEAAFAEAATLGGDARSAYLERLRADDPRLHAEVVTLLAADARAEHLLDDAVHAATHSIDAMQGRRIGAWRLEERIGAGGMGAIYRAERADGAFRQTVALKLIKRGLDSEEILRRFEAERQILAGLEHPNIARLVDGGLTDDGAPWFAMEFVEGKPIDVWCDEQRLSTDQRIDLFLAVCDAVDYAERHLVIHRDLKPSNVFVTTAGDVKLLDFGVAKVLAGERESGDATELTRAGSRVMTPAYAAPEQVLGAPVSTATDAYQLGVVLYELLAGRRPYSAASIGDLEQAVLRTDPGRPSDAVLASAPAGASEASALPPEEASARRATTPDRLRRRLAGDLDTICLMALRKEPERRYASAGALAEDLRRHRRGVPVVARPDTRAYRLEKFLVRHRAGVLATAAAAILVTGLTATYLVRLRSERDRARVAEQRALDARDEANAVTSFLVGTLSSANPARMGRDVRVRDALDSAAATIERLSDRPLLEARVRETIGRTYDGLGVPAQAEAHYRRSEEIRSTHPGTPFLDLLTVRLARGNLRHLYGSAAGAESLLTIVLRDATDSLGAEHRVALDASRYLGGLYARAGRLDEAAAMLESALPRMAATLGPDDEVTLSSTWILGTVHHDAGRMARAESLYVRALEAQRRVQGPESHGATNTMNSLASLYTETKRYAEAEPLLQDVIGIISRRSGPEHLNTLIVRQNLADLYHKSGRSELALSTFRDVYEKKRRVAGPNAPTTLFSMINVGAVMSELGDRAGAAAWLRETVPAARRAWPAGHVMVGAALMEYAKVLAQLGRHAAAERTGLDAWQALEAQQGAAVVTTRSKVAEVLADVYQQLGRDALAAEWRARVQPADSAR